MDRPTLSPVASFPWGLRSFVLIVLIAIFLAYLARDTYRVFLHPLARFPGPRAAARSKRWIYKASEYAFVEADLARIHEQYGMFPRRLFGLVEYSSSKP